MRTIKFKGKRVDTGEWVFGDLIHGVGSKHGRMYILPVTNIYPKGCNELDGWEVIPETVGQFTGLPDKNGIEIYEGDILGCVIHPQIYYGAGKDDYDIHKGLTCYHEVIYNPLQTSFETKLIYVSEKGVKVGSVYKTEIAIDDRYSLSSIDGYTPKCKLEIIGNIHDNPELLKGGAE